MAFDNLKHLASFLKSRVSGASPPNGEAEQAHARALVETLTDATARRRGDPGRRGDHRAVPGQPAARTRTGRVSRGVRRPGRGKGRASTRPTRCCAKANPTSATVHAEKAWADGFNVLTRLGITYEGDHDSDGVVDVVELRFGSSPLLVDSDSDGLTDKFEITELAGWTMPDRSTRIGRGARRRRRRRQ